MQVRQATDGRAIWEVRCPARTGTMRPCNQLLFRSAVGHPVTVDPPIDTQVRCRKCGADYAIVFRSTRAGEPPRPPEIVPLAY